MGSVAAWVNEQHSSLPALSISAFEFSPAENKSFKRQIFGLQEKELM